MKRQAIVGVVAKMELTLAGLQLRTTFVLRGKARRLWSQLGRRPSSVRVGRCLEANSALCPTRTTLSSEVSFGPILWSAAVRPPALWTVLADRFAPLEKLFLMVLLDARVSMTMVMANKTSKTKRY
ncbi:MAG: hypothetical protein AUK47_17725 [Deltaproteobacteria bacterium CG2_30_63_29]|nr:MAG: hypothetical protein AUK47_17725 [Deltaproteobacteria bacterium CG2_30_63_29]